MGEGGCIDPCILDLGTSWSGQLHTLASLPPVPIQQDVGWAPEPEGTMWKGEKSCPYQDWNSDPSAVQPVASCYTDCAIPAPTRCVYMRK
jgi:hypothetical protein